MTVVPGLGIVPGRWKTERARYVLIRQRRSVRGDEGIVTAFRDGQVTLRDKRRTDGFTQAIQEIGYQGIRVGDLVVHSMDGFAGAIGVSDSDGKASPVVHSYVPVDGIDVRFIAYVLRLMAQSGFVTTLAKGIRERSTAFDSAVLADVLLPIPSLEEQRRIADFIDVEARRIGAVEKLLIRAKLLLKERSRAVVDSALSGFSNQGTVSIATVCSSVFDCVNKTAPTVDYETPYKMIRTSNIRNGFVDTANTFRTSEEVFKAWNRRGTPRKGDVLLTREAPLGEVGMLNTDESVFLGQRIILYRANVEVMNPRLLLQNLLSSRSLEQFKFVGAGSLHAHMRVHDAMKIKIVCPPREEQDGLASRIDHDRSSCIALEAKLDRQIALLAERRRALITAAVTGQIDVTAARGVEVP